MPGMTTHWMPYSETPCTASMRPRLNAGDDDAARAATTQTALASMRPRLNAGDDTISKESLFGGYKASMRPRLNAGDDTTTAAGVSAWASSFNEAPAKCRG